jgi:hypothetical protein
MRKQLTGAKNLKRQLSILTMPPAERQRKNKILARKAMSFSKKRVRFQRGLDGMPWAPRKSRSKKKMLKGLSREMKAFATADTGTVAYKSYVTGKIAREQQEGINKVFTKAKAQQRYGKPNYDAQATTSQAKALRNEGYKIRRNKGKGYKKATLKWIKENMTLGQAGVILRSMRDSEKKTSWVIPLPARSFLGANAGEREQMMDFIFNDTRQQLKR